MAISLTSLSFVFYKVRLFFKTKDPLVNSDATEKASDLLKQESHLDPATYDWAPLVQTLRAEQSFLLTTHVNSDGDGLGAECALALALLAMGKQVCILNPTPLPETFSYLFDSFPSTLIQAGTQPNALPEGLDRVIVLDVSSRHRIGFLSEMIEKTPLPITIIDHHMSFDFDHADAHVFPTISSTGEVLAHLLKAMEIPFSKSIAQALYVSLYTDTGGFVFSSTTADTLDLAADLVRAGANPTDIFERIHQNQPPERFALQALFLDSMESHFDGRLRCFSLPQSMLDSVGATREHADGFSNMGLAMQGCLISLVIGGSEAGLTKANLRAKAPMDVCEMVRPLGGGGHRLAAGVNSTLPPQELKQALFAAAAVQLAQMDKESQENLCLV
jgi:bifunctional oligoribonuclease and PAP phosphatase NrnA